MEKNNGTLYCNKKPNKKGKIDNILKAGVVIATLLSGMHPGGNEANAERFNCKLENNKDGRVELRKREETKNNVGGECNKDTMPGNVQKNTGECNTKINCSLNGADYIYFESNDGKRAGFVNTQSVKRFETPPNKEKMFNVDHYNKIKEDMARFGLVLFSMGNPIYEKKGIYRYIIKVHNKFDLFEYNIELEQTKNGLLIIRHSKTGLTKFATLLHRH